jgi:acetyl esterase/lipase
MRLTFFTGFLCLAVTASAQQSPWPPAPGHTVLAIWPGAAPDATPAAGPEQDTAKPGEGLIAGRPIIRLGNVSTPTLTVYPAVGSPNGAGIVVFPGGGYSILAIDLEGTEVCDWLTHRGIACILLKYRVPNSGPYPKSPQALEDAQRALGLVRQHAAEWGIDPHRLGVLGFSAGAHLAAALSTHDAQRLYPAIDAADSLPCRPDFAAIIYPGYLADASKNMTFSPDIPVTADTPPSFILQAEDDPVHVENATAYFLALKQAKVPAELHIYAEGGHGYGLRRTSLPITAWPGLVDTWLKTIKMVP